MRKPIFEILGYSLDFYIGTKFIGSMRIAVPDRKESGYAGRKRFTTLEDVVLDNRKVIKAGTYITTEMNQINGKVIDRPAILKNKKSK